MATTDPGQPLLKTTSAYSAATAETDGGNHQHVDEPEPLYKRERFSRRKSVWALRHVILAGILTASVGNIPGTQVLSTEGDTFGDDTFLIAGILGALTGLLHFFLTPAIGTLSDHFGRAQTVALCGVLTMVPYLTFSFGLFKVGFVLTVVFSFSHAQGALLFAAASDVLPAASSTVDQPFIFGVLLITQASTGLIFATIGASMKDFRLISAIASLLTVGTSVAAWWLLHIAPKQPPAELVAFEARQIARREIQQANDAREDHDGIITDTPTMSNLHRTSGSVSVPAPLARALGRTSSVCAPELDVEEGPAAPISGPLCGLSGRTSSRGLAATSIERPMRPAHEQSEEKDLEEVEAANREALEKAFAAPERAPSVMRHLSKAVAQLRRNRQLQVITAIAVLNGLAEQTLDVLMPLYLSKTLKYSQEELILIEVSVTVGKVFAYLIFVPATRRFIGTLHALRVSLAANALWISVMVFIGTPVWQGVSVCLLSAFALALYPIIAGLTAQSVAGDPDAGLAQGVVVGARALAAGLSPAIVGTLFHFTKSSALPASPLFIGTVTVFGAFVLTFWLRDDEAPLPEVTAESVKEMPSCPSTASLLL